MKRIEVAVGVIRRDDGKVLVGQRTVKDLYFGKWEFPGGKLEAGETVTQALERELAEELGIQVLNVKQLTLIEHDYPDRQVLLHVLEVSDYGGEPNGKEGQALQWVTLQQLGEIDFLQGNQVIIDLLLQAQR